MYPWCESSFPPSQSSKPYHFSRRAPLAKLKYLQLLSILRRTTQILITGMRFPTVLSRDRPSWACRLPLRPSASSERKYYTGRIVKWSKIIGRAVLWTFWGQSEDCLPFCKVLWNTTFSHIIFNKTWLYLVIGIDGLYELFW
jgi:hypothetical protein